MTIRIPLTGDERSLEELVLEHSQKCSTTNYAIAKGVVNESKKARSAYLLPWATKTPRRKREESVGKYLLRLLASEVIRYGMRYKGQHPDHTDQILFFEMQMQSIRVADRLQKEFSSQLQGRTFRTDALMWGVEENLGPMVLWNFRRETYTDLQERASRAGRAFKSYNLESHLLTAHLSVSVAARHLGISRNSVYAMRREYADVDLTTGELYEEEQTASHNGSAVTNPSRNTTGAETEDRNLQLEIHDEETSSRPSSSPQRPGKDREELAHLELPF